MTKTFKHKAEILGDGVVQSAPNAANWLFKKCSSSCVIKNIQLMFWGFIGMP